MNSQICPNCNSENSGERVICEVCGAPIQGSRLPQADQDQPHAGEGIAEKAKPAPPGVQAEHDPAEVGESSSLPQKEKASEDDLDEWLRGLPPPSTGELGLRGKPRDTDGALPTWLQEVRAKADQQSPASEQGLVDWLTGLEEDGSTPANPGQQAEELPEWVAALTQPEKWPDTDDPELMADWLARTDDFDDHRLPQTSELPSTAPLGSSRELEGIPEQLVGDSLPEWLMREAGGTDELESADYLPATREPLIGQHSEQDWDDTGEEGNTFLSKPAVTSEEMLPDDELADAGDEQFDWLEEIEDQKNDIDLDEIFLADDSDIHYEEPVADFGERQSGEKTIVDDQDLDKFLAETLLLNEVATNDPDAELLFDEKLPIDTLDDREQDAESIFAEIPPPETLGEQTPVSASEEWLGYLEDTPGIKTTDSVGEAPLQTDLDLEPAEIPEWLRALKPGDHGLSERRSTGEDQEESGPLAGLPGVIPLAVAATGTGRITRPTKFETTKEQQQQIALLRQLTLILPEGPKEGTVSGDKDRFLNERLVLGTLLLLVVTLGYFLPFDRWFPFLSEWTISQNTQNAYQALNRAENANVLMAFEYTPAMAGEMDVVADSVLAELADKNATVLTISQAAAGVVMAHDAVERSEIALVHDFGFLPGDAAGLRGLGNCLSQRSECTTQVGLPLVGEIAPLLDDIGLIVILTGDRDSLVNWIEQVGSQTDVPVIAGLAQSLSPVASPYLLSDQLAGLIEGAPAAMTYDYSLAGTDQQNSQLLRAFTMGQYLFIVVIIAGILFFWLLKRPSKSSGQVEVRGH